VIGIIVFCAAILIFYLVWRNIKDEKEMTKTFFNDEIKAKKHEPNN
jgi:hypothetical protein